MDKKLQDLAWSILPKEFKEEVKKYYDNSPVLGVNAVLLLENLFGIDNLTSDAEGEEMLTCDRDVVRMLYDRADSVKVRQTLESLFGSKCLPDASNVASTEPKFKVGDKVRMKGCGYEPNLHKGGIGEILDTNDEGQCFVLFKKSQAWIYADCLEPYTEPEEKTCTDTCTDDCSSQCKSQDFDRIINDGFRNHNRLHVAAMAMQGLLANTALYEHKVKEWLMCKSNDNPIHFIPMLALKYADALIAERGKGGEK